MPRVHFERSTLRMNGASSSGIGGAAAVASTTTSTSSSSTSGRQNRVKSECFAAAAAPGTAAALVAGRSAHPSAPSAMPSPHPALSAFGQQAARGPGVALERSTSGGTSGGPGSGAGRRSIDCGPLTPTPRSADARLFPHTSFSPSPHSPPTNPFSGGRAPPPVRHSIVELASGTGSSGPGAAACASMAAAAYSNPFREPKKQPQMMSTSPSPYEAGVQCSALKLATFWLMSLMQLCRRMYSTPTRSSEQRAVLAVAARPTARCGRAAGRGPLRRENKRVAGRLEHHERHSGASRAPPTATVH